MKKLHWHGDNDPHGKFLDSAKLGTMKISLLASFIAFPDCLSISLDPTPVIEVEMTMNSGWKQWVKFGEN